MAETFYGTCKFFSSAKGYGFITEMGEAGKDYFVHYSSIQMDGYKVLEEGQNVKFEVEETAKGKQAVNVMLDE